MAYYTYILRCADDSLYTGITTDPVRRFAQHSGGKTALGAKYTASHPPIGYECAFRLPDKSSALKLEYRIKQLTRRQKLALIAGGVPPCPEMPDCRRVEISPEGEIK